MLSSLRDSFKRNTYSTKFIPEIDGMRFFAIMTVVIFHLNTAYSREMGLDLKAVNTMLGDASFFGLGWWIKRFDIGVKVFFAISGFILAVPFIKYYVADGNKINIKNYFIRRLLRLEPPFIISMILFFFVHLLVLKADVNELLKSFGVGILYLHTTVFGVYNPINPVSWSLETEAQFYILVPLLMTFIFISKKKIWIYVLFLILFMFSVLSKNYIMTRGNGHFNLGILAFLVNFMVGIFTAFLYVMNKNIFQVKNYIWDVIYLLSIFIMFSFYKPQDEIFNIILMNFGLFIFIISVFKSKVINWFFTRPIIYTIGGMCYSIYLLHYAFYHLSVKFTSKIMIFNEYPSNFVVQILINVPIVLLVSSIFFLLFEKPFMNNNWIKKMNFKKLR
ncbi:acyltransferase family protein [Aureibaculum conchae]|uniref:acyltransferase family protein n=1 Tax=Aureibaculum sp. 2308TA14-22 TaxID=3108392 RepID=UPI0033979BCE